MAAPLKFPRIICHFDESEKSKVSHFVPFDHRLSEEEAHHLIKVLRKTVGDEITVIDSQHNRFFRAKIISTSGQAQINIFEAIDFIPQSSYVSVLLFALCKGDHNDLVAEKACELGVGHIVFWQAERSVVNIKGPDEAQKKIERWNKILQSAAKQCGNPLITTCSFTKDVTAAISECDKRNLSKKYFAALTEEKIEIADLKDSPTHCAIAIGPEGDFTPQEIKILQSSNFSPIGLGPLILRAETAAISTVAGINAKWGFTTSSPSN